jgi:hypothetical protein
VAGSFRFGLFVAAALIVAAAATGVVFGARLMGPGKAASAVPIAVAAPTAEAVAAQLAGATNARSAMVGGGTIAHVSCLHGGARSYACSYVRTSPAKGSSCAVAILLWTPQLASTFTVQTAGRVALAPSRCGPVTKVLHVLGTSG